MRSRRTRAGLVFAAMFVGATAAAQSAPTGIPVFFVENRDRHEASVRYHVDHTTGAVLIKDGAIVFREHGRADLRVEFPGSSAAAHATPEAALPTRVNYLIGREPDWRTGVPTFERIRYAELWPGIDLVLHGARGEVKYEFHVAPGADPRAIRMRWVGAQLAVGAHGSLHIGGDTERTDPAPVSWQGTERVPVASAFALASDATDEVGFAVGDYDRSRTLVIDPAFIVASGHLIPNMTSLQDIAVDATGAVYVGGAVLDAALMLQGVVAKVRPDYTAFDFITYVSGAKGSIVTGVAVDATGVYAAGNTSSDEQSFPVRAGPSLVYAGGGLDAFVCKLSLDGQSIRYCGYVGGTQVEGVRGVAVDGMGALWIAGQTDSPDYPTRGGPQTTMPGPAPGTLTKVAPDGRSLLVSGFIGGAGPAIQYCTDVDVDAAGDAYVVGRTLSDERSFPVMIGPMTTLQGVFDAFVMKVDGTSGTIHYAGYVGGALDEWTARIVVDRQGAAYVCGQTQSDEATFPIVRGPWPRAAVPPSQRGDGYLAKIKPDGSGFDYSGFLGGVAPLALAVDTSGRVSVAGNVIATPPYPVGGALSGAIAVAPDAVLLRIAQDGGHVEYGGYLGGHHVDSAHAVALGPTGAVHVAGVTRSSGTFPVRVGPNLLYGSQLQGSFLTKVGQTVAATPLAARPGASIAIDCVASEDVGLPFQVGTALGGGPITLPGQRRVDLSPDGVLQVSVDGTLPGVFRSYAGTVPANGQWTSTIVLPPFPALVGVNLFTAFLTFAPGHPGGIKSISNATPTTIVP